MTGNQKFQADRIADVLEQVDELRTELGSIQTELQRVAERQDKMAEYIKSHVKKPKEAES